MSDQAQGDYPSPTASQSGPYPHRPTNSNVANASSVTADAQLAHQLLQATEHAQQQSSDYGRSPPQQQQNTPQQQQAVANAQQAMQWGAAGGVSGPPPHNTTAAPTAPQPSAQQYAQYPIEMHPHMLGAGQVSPGDDEPTKKKQKTSRACDECRRKKIKCDGDGEKPGFKCANCMRTGAECLYTKPAQKRGPSRGYIRELSDRVASLEGLNSAVSPMTPQNSSSIFADGVDSHGVKRTHSISEHGVSELKTPHSATGTPAAPLARMGSGSYASFNARPQYTMDLPPPSNPLAAAESEELTTFMKAAQTGLQALPDDVKITEHLLDKTPSSIRDTFFRSLKAVNTLPTSRDRTLYKEAFSSALSLAHKPSSVSPQANIIHLQICVLLLYVANAAGPDQPDADEPNSAMLVGVAVKIAQTLRVTSPPDAFQSAIDEVADTQSRRTYAMFLVLMVWTSLASGESLDSLFPGQFQPRTLQKESGDGHWYAAMGLDLIDFHLLSSNGTFVYFPRQLYVDGVLDGSHTSVEQLSPGVRVMKAGLQILTNLCVATAQKGHWVNTDMIKAATEIVHTLSAKIPFYIAGHQILALAVRVLVLAHRHESTRGEAVSVLKEAQSASEAGKLLQGSGEWSAAIEKVIATTLGSAAAEPEDAKFAWIDDIKSGWLRHFHA